MFKVPSSIYKYNGVRFLAKLAEKSKPVEPFQVSNDINGMTVISIQPKIPTISKVAAVFNAGSRYEDHETTGMNHLLRRSVGLSSGGYSAVNVTRHFQQMGTNLRCYGTRDTLSYVVDFSKDLKDDVLELLGHATTRQSFYTWELNECSKKLMEFDIQYLNRRDFDTLCSELLHKAAYRDTFGNSLFANQYKLGDWNIDAIEKFVNNNFSANRCTLIGISVDHHSLTKAAEKFQIRPKVSLTIPKAMFRGGEIRKELPIGMTKVALVWEAPGLNKLKEALAASILADTIDSGMNMRIKWNSGDLDFIKQVVKNPEVNENCVANSLYTTYSESGMLGFAVDGSPDVFGEAVTTLYKHFLNVGKNGVSQKDFDIAKNGLKLKLISRSESLDGLAENMISLAASENNGLPIAKLIEISGSITIDDVNKVAKSIFSNPKQAMSAVGELYNVPFLLDLQSS